MGKTSFRKIKRIGAMEQVSYPMSRTDVTFDTIGLYEEQEDGRQMFLDEMTDEEMSEFRAQDDFEEILEKLK